MALDIYHQVLKRVHDEADGGTRRLVNLREAAKKDGLHGSIDTIHEYLTRQGWIADAAGHEMVCITPWGIQELQRTGDGGGVSDEAGAARRLAATARELAGLLEKRAEAVAAGDEAAAAGIAAEAVPLARELHAGLPAAPAGDPTAPAPPGKKPAPKR
jgi:hypothetical protein